MRLAPSIALISILALGLSACGDSSEGQQTVPRPASYEPTVALTPIQKGSFLRLNRDEVRQNYQKIWAEVAAAGAESQLPGRDDMEFAWLDRDKDGKLSVAEFALWDVPRTSPDNTDLTDAQITEAASLFFSHDLDGDTMLSEAEFASAAGKPAPQGDDSGDESAQG